MRHRQWLVFGGTGGVGSAVLDRLGTGADPVHAVSRGRREAVDPSRSNVIWRTGDLDRVDPAVLPVPTHVVSAGPLDAFARHASRARWAAGTAVVALSSMSASTKAERGHASERAVSRRLRDAEQRLIERAHAMAWRLVVLRPTLIWGAGDRSITPLLRVACRTGVLPLPAGATGLRQPVHAEDLAQALVGAALDPGLGPGPWPAPGGEVLGFDEMLRRALAVAVPTARMWRLPDAPCRVLESGLVHAPGRLGLVVARLRRARADLDVADAAVWRHLGIVPRGFAPGPDSFPGVDGRPGPRGR